MSAILPTQFAYRSVSGVGLSSGHPDFFSVENLTDDDNTKTFQYSKDGRYFGCASAERVVIINAETVEIVKEIKRKNVVEIGFSPKGTFLTTWERPVKLEENVMHKNLILWEVESGKELISFAQKSQSNWNVQWTEDESFFSRMVTGEVHFYASNRIDKEVHSKLRLEGIADFSLSPGKSPSIAVFIPEKKAGPARVQIFSITNFNTTLAQKTFYKADKIQMKWNDLGTNLLVLTHTDVDKTNKSYYGETNLYSLSVAGNYDCRVQLDKEGPIHDVTWSPNSKEFIVIYGYMPAKATLFDHRANPAHELGINPRNIAPNSSESAWSPDGRYIMTATLSPRLRVDNGYKIWHYTGVLVHARNVNELLQVGWRPASVNLFPIRSLSPPPPAAQNAQEFTVKPPSKIVGAYRPPHARGQATPDHFKREDETSIKAKVQPNGTKSSNSTDSLSKISAKNKKKREAKKKKDEAIQSSSEIQVETTPLNVVSSELEETVILSNGSSIPIITEMPLDSTSANLISDTQLSSQSGTVLTETEKKIRNLTKKLRQIAELKDRQANGDKLEQTQILKIATAAALERELQQLRHIG
ncbi:hypothetical protein G9A89_014986 [Geosiphon pyriformis]|nr:hypothetical protein G9A89_014986 [Geosiphon pyriformis]